MYAEMMSAFGGSMRNFVGPVQKMNQMAIAHVGKIVAMQMESVKSHASLGIGQIKAATDVDNPWGFFCYMAKQGSYMTKVGEQVVADVQKMSQLGGDFIEKAQTVAHEEARTLGTAFGETSKGSAKKAA